jgi:hypothetical protein
MFTESQLMNLVNVTVCGTLDGFVSKSENHLVYPPWVGSANYNSDTKTWYTLYPHEDYNFGVTFEPGGMVAVGNGRDGNKIAYVLKHGDGYALLLQQNRYFETYLFVFNTWEELLEGIRIHVSPMNIKEYVIAPSSMTGTFDTLTKENAQKLTYALTEQMNKICENAALYYEDGWHSK